MYRWFVLACLASCVSSNSVVCSDGSVCPRGSVCDPHGLCVSPDQLTACDGKSEGADCMFGSIGGHCQDGVCLDAVCGDGFVEIGEQCDDGNTVPLDGCSADCASNETCGNDVVDLALGETCDDGNHLDHDGCSSRCQIETPRWIEHTLSPSARASPSFAYDSGRDRVVMVGGVPGVSGVLLDDTLEWNGFEWMRIPTPVAPTARSDAGMAYDAARKESVLYGGSGGFSSYSDTWLWNGNAWRLAATTTGPGVRAVATMAYDTRRERVVLFGGATLDATGMQAFPADTWEWDGATWKQIMTPHSPGPREHAAMTYDPERGVIVLVGGGLPAMPLFSDTWEYDGADWTMKSNAAPPLWRAALTYDTKNHRVLLFGGNSPTLSAWNGTAWSTVTTTGGPPSTREQELFVQTSSHILMFGGQLAVGTNNGETWLLDNTTWSQPIEPGPRIGALLANDPLHTRQILYGGVTQTTPVARTGQTWDVSIAGYTLRANAPPTARDFACLTYDYAHRNLVMFGGEIGATNPSTVTNETWIWDGSGWTQKFPATSPPPRVGPACAFDGQRVTIMGGFDNGNREIADAWTWDGTTWAPVAIPATMIARGAAAAGYDQVRRRMVLFSGFSPNLGQIPTDTWLFDGQTWTQVATDGFRPSARFGAAMVWDPARQSLILTGGEEPLVDLDAYEWDGTEWKFVAATNRPPSRYFHGSATSLDGSGIVVYGGEDLLSSAILFDRWELRWDSIDASERCNTKDSDGDSLVACNDPDCWWVCTPLCPPGTTCDPTAPTCGDGTCDPSREDCRNCAADCTCASPVCGDGYCDPGETCPGDCP